MAKRVATTQKKSFAFDLESLLISDLTQEEHDDSQTSSSESCNQPKKFKAKNSKPLPANKVAMSVDESDVLEKEDEDEAEESSDMAKYFESFGNDFSKSVQGRKSKLGQFTEEILAIYESKLGDMCYKHEAEIQELKERTIKFVDEELNKFEDEFKKLKQQENKLVKIMEQLLKMMQKTSEVQSEWTENFRKLHDDFVQAFEEMKAKHKNEAMELKKSIATDVCHLQNKFLMESKKEEMQTIKKYLSSIYF